MKDGILGTYKADGSIEKYPELDVNGQRYTSTLSVCRINQEHFVVLPVNFNNHTLIDEIREGAKGKRQLLRKEDAE